ncbi:GDP-mannose 4,6-dehydratase [Micromonospora sp. NPDC048898]|uniref:GDP-mannose 4,6-dehydratase n=1 Tax=Micromonospora sp. NPDC048898 TaxID=3364260 RepID=UPI0037127A28
MRVLVTGAMGFIGGHVARVLLDEGFEVAVLDDLSSGRLVTLTELVRLGLREENVFVTDATTDEAARAVRRWSPDGLVHLAAQPRVIASTQDPVRDARTNVLGTVTMLDAAAHSGQCRVILASSGGAVYGEQAGAAAATSERVQPRPISPYGLSKATAESYAGVYGALTGLPVSVLRLGNVYGRYLDGSPGPGVLTRFARAVAAGEAQQVIGDGRQTRDFVHVHDVAEAFRLTVTTTAPVVLNIGSGQETSVLAALQAVCDALDAPAKPVHVAPITGEVGRVCLDVSAARTKLGWHATVPLDAGIRDLVKNPAGAVAD